MRGVRRRVIVIGILLSALILLFIWLLEITLSPSWVGPSPSPPVR